MMSVESFRMYVCPQCKGQLGVEATALTCPACLRAYPILDGIPDFLADDPAQSRDPVLRSVERIDRMARLLRVEMVVPAGVECLRRMALHNVCGIG